MPMGEPKCGLCGSDLMAGMFHKCTKPVECPSCVGMNVANSKLRDEVQELKDKVALRDVVTTEQAKRLRQTNMQNAQFREVLKYIAEVGKLNPIEVARNALIRAVPPACAGGCGKKVEVDGAWCFNPCKPFPEKTT